MNSFIKEKELEFTEMAKEALGLDAYVKIFQKTFISGDRSYIAYIFRDVSGVETYIGETQDVLYDINDLNPVFEYTLKIITGRWNEEKEEWE